MRARTSCFKCFCAVIVDSPLPGRTNHSPARCRLLLPNDESPINKVLPSSRTSIPFTFAKDGTRGHPFRRSGGSSAAARLSTAPGNKASSGCQNQIRDALMQGSNSVKSASSPNFLFCTFREGNSMLVLDSFGFCSTEELWEINGRSVLISTLVKRALRAPRAVHSQPLSPFHPRSHRRQILRHYFHSDRACLQRACKFDLAVPK